MSLRDHAEITGAPFLDLTADDHEASPSRVVKDEEEEVKEEADDYAVFDRYRRR